MRQETLDAGQVRAVPGELVRPLRRQRLDGERLEEGPDPQPVHELGRVHGGQRVIRSRDVVAVCHRSVCAHEQRPVVVEPLHQLIIALCHHLEVLWSEVLRDRDGFLQRVDQDDAAVVLPGLQSQLARSQRPALDGHGVQDGLRQLGARRDQPGDRVRIVLALGQKIDGDPARVGGAVGDDEDLAGSGEHVDAHATGDTGVLPR